MASCLIHFFGFDDSQFECLSLAYRIDHLSEGDKFFIEKLNYYVTIPCRVCSISRAGSYDDRTRRLEHHWNLLLGRKNSSSRRGQRTCGS